MARKGCGEVLVNLLLAGCVVGTAALVLESTRREEKGLVEGNGQRTTFPPEEEGPAEEKAIWLKAEDETPNNDKIVPEVAPIYVRTNHDCPGVNAYDCLRIQNLGGFRLVGQPSGDNNFVSNLDGEITRFPSRTAEGMDILYAGSHNILAGREFNQIKTGDGAVAYINGEMKCYEATKILRFQMAWMSDTSNPIGDLIDLETRVKYSSSELWDRLMSGENPFILQTCINKDNDPFWGRLIILYRRIDCAHVEQIVLLFGLNGKDFMLLRQKRKEKKRQRHKVKKF